MRNQIHREITPLQEDDCFLVFDRERNMFTFPIHFHPEYEINFIANAKGGRRVVGDHLGEIGNKELIMVGPNLYHGWENYKNNVDELSHEITIQFPRELFNNELLQKNILKPIREMFQNANRGILFSEQSILPVSSFSKNRWIHKFSGCIPPFNFMKIRAICAY
jgi:hypothetical protein